MLRFADHASHIQRMLDAALRAADPAGAIRRDWPGAWANGVDLAAAPVLVIAAGKSSIEMARACLELLPRAAEEAVVAAVPERIGHSLLPEGKACRVRVMPADHPLPSDRSVAAAKAVMDAVARFADRTGRDGVILALLSGGASAQLCAPFPGLTVSDLAVVSTALQRAGASIRELNCVRKHTEEIKGGRLARLAGNCRVRVLLASDVMGDAIDVVASGPFAPDPSTFDEARRVLSRLGVEPASRAVVEHLEAGVRGERSESIKAGDAVLARVDHRVLCGNREARLAAAEAASELGFGRVEHAEMTIPTVAAEQGRDLALWACSQAQSRTGLTTARILGGEPTVDTRGAGRAAGTGGPSQELALAAAEVLAGQHGAASRVAIAGFSTDGVDGPTDAAGAIVTAGTAALAGGAAACSDALRRHDSWTLLGGAGGLIRTGPTGVNVNHLALALVYPGTTS